MLQLERLDALPLPRLLIGPFPEQRLQRHPEAGSSHTLPQAWCRLGGLGRGLDLVKL